MCSFDLASGKTMNLKVWILVIGKSGVAGVCDSSEAALWQTGYDLLIAKFQDKRRTVAKALDV